MKKNLLFFTLLTFTFLSLKAQTDYYWVGGSGNWNDLTHWVTTSGGSTQQTSLPSPTDNVHFDLHSFSTTGQTVTINVNNAYCKNMDWTGATNSPTFNGILTTISFLTTNNHSLIL